MLYMICICTHSHSVEISSAQWTSFVKMVKWEIQAERKLNIDGKILPDKIDYAKFSQRYKTVEVFLKNGEQHSLQLTDYHGISNPDELPAVCRASRSEFLDWVRDFKGIPVVKNIASSEQTRVQACQESRELRENDLSKADMNEEIEKVSGPAEVNEEFEIVSGPAEVNEEIIAEVSGPAVVNEEIEIVSGPVVVNEEIEIVSGPTEVNEEIEIVSGPAEVNEEIEKVPGPAEIEDQSMQGTEKTESTINKEARVQDIEEEIDRTTAKENEVEMEEEETDRTTAKENEEEMEVNNIEKNLIGKNIKVHVSNLVEPAKERKTRDLDPEHVKVLEGQFQKELKFYSVLIGHLNDDHDITVDDLSKPGNIRVEVLGGNHTRQALVNLNMDVCINMDVYAKLSDVQALKLGIKHNDLHQFSRKTSFEDTVKLFRHQLMTIKSHNLDKNQKYIATEWRIKIAEIMDTPKSKINKFQTLFHCSSLPEAAWNALLLVFDAWKKKNVKGQPTTEIKQTHLFDLFRIHNNDEKATILDELSSGQLTFDEFKDRCLSRKYEECLKKVEDLESELAKLKCNEQEVITKNTQLLKSRQGIEEQLKNEIVEKNSAETKIKELNCKLLQSEKNNENLRLEIKALKEVMTEKEKKSLEAEKNTAKIITQEEKIKKMQGLVNEKETMIDNLTRQLNLVQDAANRARMQVKELTKKRPTVEPTEEPKETVSEPPLKKLKSSYGQRVEKNLSATQTKTSENEEVALVEYTNQKLYLGVLKDKTLTFTRQPIGKLVEDFKVKETCFTINSKDTQEIDTEYIIKKFKCSVNNNKIVISDEQKKELEKSVTEYMKKK